MDDPDAFIEQWGLDESSQAALSELDPNVQAKILAEFAPKAGTRDVNRLFHGFIRSVSTGSSGATQRAQDAVNVQAFIQDAQQASQSNGDFHAGLEAFVSQWGLDADAQTRLIEKPPEVQARIMMEFQPKPGTRDVNRLFHGFLKSVMVSNTGGAPRVLSPQQASNVYVGGGAPPPRLLVPMGARTLVPPAAAQTYSAHPVIVPPRRQDEMGAKPRPTRARQHHQSVLELDVGTVQAFIAQWGLDDEAQAALSEMDPSVQAKVVSDFKPRDGTRDVNRLFHGFLRSIRCGGVHGMAEVPAPGGGINLAIGHQHQRAFAPFGNEGPPTAHGTYQVEQIAADPSTVGTFVSTWGLDESAHTTLMQLDPQVQSRVMQEFAPKANTQDITRLFFGFVRSVQGRQQSASVVLPPPMHQAAHIGAAITHSLASQGGYVPPAARKRAFESVGEGAPTADEIAEFLQSWDLDSACGASLEGQPEEVQRRVLNQFRPREGTRDVKSLFHGFIKSVAGGGGAKRPRVADDVVDVADVADDEVGADADFV